MRKGNVTKRQDELGPLMDGQREELRALAELPDDQIDTSDIPPLSDAQLARMVRGRFYRPVKQQITARLDAGTLEVALPRVGDRTRRDVPID